MFSDYGVGEDWESLDYKEIKPVNPKGNQPWKFIGGTDVDPNSWFADQKSRISELIWTGMGKFNSDDHYIYYCAKESLEEME